MTLGEIRNLQDKTQIEWIEFTLNAVTGQKAGTYGTTMYRADVSDGSVHGKATFALKRGNPIQYIGKRIRLTTGKNNDGQMTGIRTDQNGNFMNLWITDSAKITEVGERDEVPFGNSPSAPPAGTPQAPQGFQRASAPPSAQPPPARPARATVPPKGLAEILAREWVAVYDWTKDIFNKVLDEAQVPERVTSIVIEMRKLGVEILPPPKQDWRFFEPKPGEPLGKFPPERMHDALIKLYRGEIKTDAAKEALSDAAKESFPAWDTYQHLLNREGVPQDIADTVLLKEEIKAIDASSPPESIIEMIAQPGFIEGCKLYMATRTSVLDSAEDL